MYALTLADDWADKIAHHGKDVENRTRRPPAHLIGHRIAIHAGRNASKHAGRIVATARLVGWNRTGHKHITGRGPCCYDGLASHSSAIREAHTSPWFTGPVGWVLADVVALPEPVEDIWVGTLCGTVPVTVTGGPIRGQVYPFTLSPEVEAEVLRQEAAGRSAR